MNGHFKTIRIHLIGVSVLAVYLIVGYYAALRPVVIADQQFQQIAHDGESLLDILPQLEQELATLHSQLKDRRSALADKYSIATPGDSPLIGVATELLQRHQIALVSLRETSTAGGVVSLTLQVTAAYDDLICFLEDLSRLDRPVRILSLNLIPENDEAIRFNVAITLKFPVPAVSPLTPTR